jgi:hypothetical protein
MDSTGSGQGSVAGSAENGDEPSGFIKGGKFLGRLSDYELMNNDRVIWSSIIIAKATSIKN